MSTALSALRTSVQNLGYGTDTAAQQTAAINGAYRTVFNYRPWAWRETTDDATASVNTEIVTTSLATDIGNILSIRLADGTVAGYDLEYKPPGQFRRATQLDLPAESGLPRYWTKFGGSFRLYPKPDKAYTVVFDYLKTFALLSGDSDTIAIPDEFADVLVFGALKRIALRERDSESAALYEQEYQRIFASMLANDTLRQRQTTSQVVQVDNVSDWNARSWEF